MGTWNVDGSSEPGILRLKLDGWIAVEEMRAFVQAHNAAIDAFRGRDYKVWCDVSSLRPLSQESAELFEKAKRYSASRENFRGSSVLVSDAVVALQHRRTSVDGGVMATELISHDEAQLRDHLKKVYRTTESSAGNPKTQRKPGAP